MTDTNRINQLNIALMLASCAIAIYLPFQLFLFAYAFLGPAHYLTEISWLQKRTFFTKGRYDSWFLLALGAIGTALLIFRGRMSTLPVTQALAAGLTFCAFGAALVFMLTNNVRSRALGLTAVAAVCLLTLNANLAVATLVALLGTSLVHVYVFTGLFILFGALKEKNRNGYLSFAVFLLCPILCICLQPQIPVPSEVVATTYWTQFSTLNRALLGIGELHSQADADRAIRLIFSSPAGLAAMRFIAFAYTYHYLNWFSKTSVIKWHRIAKSRLALLAVLWLISVALYLYDFSLGFKVLTFLSLTHVYLEFPLNHISIIGICRELLARGRLGRATA